MLRHCRHSFQFIVSIIPIYIHTNEYVVAVVKSSRELPFHLPSILKYKNPLLSLLFSSFFQAKLLTFFVTVIACCYFAVCAASETDATAGHFGSRAITNNLYTDDLLACQNSDHRARAEQFAHRNDNPHARQKDDSY